MQQRGTRHLAAWFTGTAVAGCAAPLSTLDTAGPSAHIIETLWWVLLVGAALISALVAALLLWAFAKRQDDTSVDERRWLVWGGIAFPLVVLSALTVYGVAAGERLLAKPAPDVVRVDAIGHRFWWEFVHYDEGGRPIYSASELRVPAGVPVDVHITSADVIHSFWVPRLAGKMDAIPGAENILRIEADRPGVYAGRCAEFCGAGHARNSFSVRAMTRADHAAWLASPDASAPPAAVANACAGCHSVDPRIRGNGPNLASLAERRYPPGHAMAAAPEVRRRWLAAHAGGPAETSDEAAIAWAAGVRP